MVTNVQSLLKTVKTVEDEAARGTRALESAIEAICQEIKLYSTHININTPQVPISDDTDQQLLENIASKPEDLVKATKQITLATSKSIGAANSLRQQDVIAAANMGRKAVSDLLYICRGDSKGNNAYQKQVLSVGLNCAMFYKELLECIQTLFNCHNSGGDEESVKGRLMSQSRSISDAVGDVLQIAEMLRKAEGGSGDGGDVTVLGAENELLGAANAIESAAKKLSALQPRKSRGQTDTENLNFDEQILEAAKSITNAAGVLIKAATGAQKELVAQGKVRSFETFF